MTKLNDLHDNPGARKSRVRVGRGIGSGCGKTGGRGQKGQKSRSGVAIKGFEGGQMPLHMRLPKRGFNNIFRKDYSEINLGTLQAMIDAGRLDAGKLIDLQVLVDAGIITHGRDGLRLLAKGVLTSKVTLKMAGASAAAKAAVEAAGGSLELPAPKPEPLTRDEQKAARAVAREAKAAKFKAAATAAN
ncbi:50S ribosomal protein L15 [Polymorphobacter glacialis]|uniref:Large ribosomal subunit protein uL15 n=1 Tax=Sandarakinorhabdus glacialis TaxID=1614636 RepID=A0A917E9W5_9SPHN|nr:50S ribosomal protein L15 [Polymorphobacter glacialis]GGE17693.1 50S ribosomal protein L15 [Polymorphobacter glacialis]